MKFSILLTITHDELPEPVEHSGILEATSMTDVLKQLSVTNKQLCDLKNYGSTAWIDDHDAYHKLELRPVI